MKRTILSTGIAAALLSGAFLMSPGPVVTDADAGPRVRHRGDNSRGYDAPRRTKHKVKRKIRRHHRRSHVRPHVRAYRRPAPRAACRLGARPWYVGNRRILLAGDPYYYHAGLEVYVGGLGLQIELGNHAPDDYLYADPYCDLTFQTIGHYRGHLKTHRHRPALYLTGSYDDDEYYYYDDDDSSGSS